MIVNETYGRNVAGGSDDVGAGFVLPGVMGSQKVDEHTVAPGWPSGASDEHAALSCESPADEIVEEQFKNNAWGAPDTIDDFDDTFPGHVDDVSGHDDGRLDR